MRWGVTYQIDSHGPLVKSKADVPDKLMEMAHQTGHDLGEAGVSIGASGSDDLLGQGRGLRYGLRLVHDVERPKLLGNGRFYPSAPELVADPASLVALTPGEGLWVPVICQAALHWAIP